MLNGIAEAEAPVFVAQSTDSVLEPSTAPPKSLQKPQTASTSKGNCAEYRDIISAYPWPVETALAVCSAESGGNTDAVNWNDNHGTCRGSAGLFQVGCLSGSVETMKIAEKNVAVAYSLWKARGWQPWSVCRSTVKCI